MDDYSGLMPEIPTEGVTPFVFSDPTGKRWPRLRLILLIAGVLFFLVTVLFVQTLFVAPQMSVPFSLRQLKGQLKALKKRIRPANCLRVRCCGRNSARRDRRQRNSVAQHLLLRRGRERNRPTMKCGSHFIPMGIPTATRPSNNTRRRLRICVRNG